MDRSTLLAAVTLTVASPVHTWDRAKGDWVAEASITITATAPVDIDVRNVSARVDGELMTLNFHQGCDRFSLGAGEKRLCPAFVYHLTRQGGRAQPKKFTFAYEQGTPVTAAPLVIATTGLELGAPAKAKVVETPRPAHGHVHQKPAWGVRIYVTLKNTTKAPVRVLQRHFQATLDDGTKNYWGDDAGYSGTQEIAAGSQADGDLFLMFVSDKAPKSMTLRYGDGKEQTVKLSQ